MTLFKKNDLRCPVCLSEFNSQAMKEAGIKGCPTCKTSLQPMLIENDGYIKINWQDLRVLAIYSRRWTMTFDLNKKGNRDAVQALENILAHLSKYKPKQSEPLVPAVDPVMVGRIEPEEEEIDFSKPIEFKTDEQGNILSPFFKKRS